MKYSCSGCSTGCKIMVEEKNGEYEVDGHNCYAGKLQAIDAYKEQAGKDQDLKENEKK